MKKAVFSTNPITGIEYYHGIIDDGEDNSVICKYCNEIIRCGECVYFEPNNYEEGDSTGLCRNNNCPCQNQQTDMVWFCADAERKE